MEQTDATPTRGGRHRRSGSVDETPTGRRYPKQQFKATAMWNNIVTCFTEEGPRKRHRKQFTYVEDSFTGKEAVDFLMEEIPSKVLAGVPVSRENCCKLLQKLMEKNIFHKYRGSSNEKDTFREGNALYVYADSHCVRSKTPRLIAEGKSRLNRANSLKGTSSTRVAEPSSSPLGIRYKVCASPSPEWHTSAIPNSPPPPSRGFNRRQSMSHGNLLSLVSNCPDSSEGVKDSTPVTRYNNTRVETTPTCDRTRIEVLEELPEPGLSLSQESLPSTSAECLTDGTTVMRSTDADSESAYEWLSFGRRKKKKIGSQTPKPSNPDDVLREVNGGSVSRNTNVTTRSRDYGNKELDCGHSTAPAGSKAPVLENENEPVVMNHLKVKSRMLTEIDMWSIWKSCLIARLRACLLRDDLSFLCWEICGRDVKWNCEKIGTSGVVKARTDSDDFSGYLMRLMKYLEQFPFPTGSCNVITYKDNQEVNVFKTVCSNLERDPPLLLASEARALLHIISLFHEAQISTTEVPPASIPANTQLETEFSSASTPFTRLIPRRSVGGASSCSLASPLSEISEPPTAIRTNGITEGTQITFSAISDDSIGYVDGVSPPEINRGSRVKDRRRSDKLLDHKLDMRDVLTLPGLKQSPELISRLNEMCVTPVVVNGCNPGPSRLGSSVLTSGTASYRTTRSVLSPATNMLSRASVDRLLACVSLLLLSLPCSRRRRLHHLIRFMNKISSNHCLQLDRANENRYVILESLAACIVPCDSQLSAVQAMHLVTLLMDNEKRLFGVDERLREDVVEMTREKQREQMITTDELFLNEVPTPPANVIQFCEKIQPISYDDQKDAHSQETYLLQMLDQFLGDTRMKESEREKRLKQFKKTYPELYARRFSAVDDPLLDKENHVGFFRKLFNR